MHPVVSIIDPFRDTLLRFNSPLIGPSKFPLRVQLRVVLRDPLRGPF